MHTRIESNLRQRGSASSRLSMRTPCSSTLITNGLILLILATSALAAPKFKVMWNFQVSSG